MREKIASEQKIVVSVVDCAVRIRGITNSYWNCIFQNYEPNPSNSQNFNN